MRKLTLSMLCAWFVIILSLTVMIGWQFDLIILRSLIPNAPQTMPLTALMLLILGLALMTARKIVAEQWATRWIWICWGLAGVAVLMAIWTGLQYIFRLGPNLELILYPQLVMQTGGAFPGRPSPHTTLTCLFVGGAIGLAPLSGRRAIRIATILQLGGMLIPWLALFGYASLINPFFAVPGNPETGMSPLTAFGFLALLVGLIGLRPAEGLMGLLTASSAGGRLVRWLLPAGIVINLIFGWFDASVIFAINWGVTSLLFAALVIWQGFILHSQDIERAQAATEREEMLAELERAAGQIRQFNAELKQQADALEQSNLELRQFTYLASHDLQTPLRSISGFAQLLQRTYKEKFDQQADDWINQTVESVRQMEAIIRGIRTYSGIDARARPFAPTPLADVFDEVVAMLATSIHDAHAQVTHDELPTVLGDQFQLVQLLQNLIENGLKYQSDEPPRIHVSATQQAGEWIISVWDNGMGIEPEYQQRIFELFRRLHTQPEYPGTGIGLAVCRKVVQRHGGKIWVESKLGQGSTFYFTLPIPKTESVKDQHDLMPRLT
jgi:signal transduction histidine kinase